MKRLCILCACVVFLCCMTACSPLSPDCDFDPSSGTEATATQAEQEADTSVSPVENDWNWEVQESFSPEEAEHFTVPIEACGERAGIIAFWKDYLLIESVMLEEQTLQYYRYSLSTGELVSIATMPIYQFGSGKSLLTQDGQYFFSYVPIDDQENLSFFRINIVTATLDLLEKRQMWPGMQNYLYHSDNYIWRFWPTAEESTDSETVYSYHIDRFDTKTGEVLPLVNKMDSRKEGISCACATNDTIFAYVYEVGENESVNCFIETYSLEGEFIKKLPVNVVRTSFSDDKEAVFDISVCDNFIFLWTSFANKCIVLEQVGEEFITVEFPIKRHALGYAPPPHGMDSSRGYIFTDEAIIRYNKETRTFIQRPLPEHSRRYMNERGNLLITDSDPKTLTCYLFTDLAW